MKTVIYADDRVIHNGTILTDVVWADPETGEAEIYEHTCSRLQASERIPDADNPLHFRTLIVRGKIVIENVKAASAPAQGAFDYGWGEGNPYPGGFLIYSQVEPLLKALVAYPYVTSRATELEVQVARDEAEDKSLGLCCEQDEGEDECVPMELGSCWELVSALSRAMAAEWNNILLEEYTKTP